MCIRDRCWFKFYQLTLPSQAVLICNQEINQIMKTVYTENFYETGLVTDNRRRSVSTFGFPLQRPVTFRHQDKEDGVGHAEQRAEGDMWQAALRPVKKRRPRIGQFVKRADEDQIRVPPQIAARNQKVSDADRQHERAQQREITAKRRQLFTDAQRGKG